MTARRPRIRVRGGPVRARRGFPAPPPSSPRPTSPDERRGRWAISAESITAASAVVAALIALAVGVWENVQERRHNRLSVFPSVELVAEVRPAAAPDSVTRASVRLMNNGVGPAIIDTVLLVLRGGDGEERAYTTWEAARPVLDAWGVRLGSRAELGEGTVLGVGNEFRLVTFELPDSVPGAAVRRFDELLHRLGIVVVYRSIYGDVHRSTLGEDAPPDETPAR